MKLLSTIQNLILEYSNFRISNFEFDDYLVQVFQSRHQKDDRNGSIRKLSYNQIKDIISGNYISGVPSFEILNSIKRNIDTIIHKFEMLEQTSDDNRIVFIQKMPSNYYSDKIEYILSGEFRDYPKKTLILTIITSAFSGQKNDKPFFRGRNQEKVFLYESKLFQKIPRVFLTN